MAEITIKIVPFLSSLCADLAYQNFHLNSLDIVIFVLFKYNVSMLDKPLSSYALLSQTEVLSSLNSTLDGLARDEVDNRLRKYGPNTISTFKKNLLLLEFLSNFRSPLVLILICISAISFLLGEHVDALIVALMVVMSVGLNFFQEHRASLAAEKLKSKVAPKAVVIRNGKREEIYASQIVIGDILELNAGGLIPADSRIISEKDLYVNQSSLTGESFPVEKSKDSITAHNPDISDLINIVFAGTSVVTGTAQAVVIKTGKNTEFGKIAERIIEEDDVNEFTKGIGDFSILVMRVVVIFVVFIFFVNAMIKHDIVESLTFAIAVAVGLTPEFLPMIMTVNMSRGSQKMAKKGVIVKRLTAIPTFGSMDILCTDKTGTLTEDKIHLVKYIDIRGEESENVFQYAYLNSFYQTGITNPMDKAVIDFKSIDTSNFKKIDEIPFDFDRKRMSVAVFSKGKHFLITKGAPEEILGISDKSSDGSKEKKLSEQDKKLFLQKYEELSRDGYRVLAISIKEEAATKTLFKVDDEKQMSLIGFIAFLDPPKEGARASIDELEAMGIEMKVITGDNELVTQKICKDADINVKGLLLGHEIESMTDEVLYERAAKSTIFARFSPIQKNRIITVLRSHGDVVGYMGDGINDAPSLKAADVGISVSNGVDVAKESADIILTNKSLHELREGVIEGRKTFGNTMKYIMMGLSSNFGNMFSVLGAVLFLPFLPMLPIQILLNNFLYDISQLTLPLDKVDEEYIKKPKRWDIHQIRNFMIVFGPISSVFDFLSFFVLFMFFKNSPGSFQTGWFMESLATQTFVIHIIRTRKLPFIQSNASPYLWITTILAVFIGWIIPMSPLGHYFGFTALPIHVIALIAGIVAVYLVFVELGKRFFYSSSRLAGDM